MDKKKGEIKEKRNKIPVRGRLYKCGKCGRKILVERTMMGVDHTLNTFVTCWECLTDKQRKKAIKMYGIREE